MNLPEECDENNQEEDSVSWFLMLNFLYISFLFLYYLQEKKHQNFILKLQIFF